MDSPLTREQPLATPVIRKRFTIGLPKSPNSAERRFPLTPEGARVLVDYGFGVIMEEGAAHSIHYTDTQYSACGVEIADRTKTLAADIVISLAPPDVRDIMHMRRGAMLLTLFDLSRFATANVKALKERNIISIAIDLVTDSHGHAPFADILSEVDGRAAMARAASMLADSVHGKGILLGGVSGVGPCEVTVIGSGISAIAAAQSATGAGALVRMFDHDVYSLREASRILGPSAVTSAPHPRVLSNALSSADIVIYTGTEPCMKFDTHDVMLMKRGVIIFDLTPCSGNAFPSLPTIDLALASPLDISPSEPSRACYINAGSAAARTAAMALSNTFATLFHTLTDCDNVSSALSLSPGMQHGTLTFLGKVINPTLAAKCGYRPVDIRIFLTLS